MQTKSFLASLLLLALPVAAQTTFTSDGLPGLVGQNVRAYYSTNNVNVASMLALTGGAQNWNFGAAQQGSESIQRTDIVDPDDVGDAATFPAATYAERDTLEPGNQIAWRYYSLTNLGRYYYGLDNPHDLLGPTIATFNQPTLDIPATVQYGQTWSRTVSWSGVYLSTVVVTTYFTNTSTVDAYGTLTLPSLGALPALRVHEVHTYASSEILSQTSFPVDLHTNQFYYWLVPGLGVAAQVFQFGDNVLYPGGLDHTNAVLRVFASSYFTNQVVLGGVTALQIHLSGTNAVLNWQTMTNASQYRVESASALGIANWQLLGLPATNSWTDAVSGNQKFYRVFGLP